MYDRPSLNGRIQTFRSSSISRPMDRCAAGCGTDGVTLWVKGAYTACTAQLRPAGPHMHHRRTAVTTVAVPVLVHASSTVLCYARETVEIRLAMKANDWGLHCSDGHRCAPINISIRRRRSVVLPLCASSWSVRSSVSIVTHFSLGLLFSWWLAMQGGWPWLFLHHFMHIVVIVTVCAAFVPLLWVN